MTSSAKEKPQKNIYDALSTDLLASIFGSSAYGIIVIDLESTIIWENDAFLRVMGAPVDLKQSKLLGMKMADLPNVQGNPIGALVLRLMEDLPERVTLQEPFESIYGKKLLIKVHVNRVDDTEGSPLGFIGSFEDVTPFEPERPTIRTMTSDLLEPTPRDPSPADVNLESEGFFDESRSLNSTLKELNQREKDLSLLIHTISHHLRTPLISASGLIGILRDTLHEGESANTEKLLTDISSSMNRLSKSFRAVVEYNDLGEHIENKTQVSLNNVLSAVQFQLSEEAARFGATVIVENSLPIVTGHRKRIERLFFEILKNAIMYGRPENDTHIVRVYPKLGQRNQYIVVEDCGNGLPQSMSSHAFRPFSRAFDELGDDQSGVGLALAHRIAQAHGWSITLQERKKQFRVVIAIPPRPSLESREQASRKESP